MARYVSLGLGLAVAMATALAFRPEGRGEGMDPRDPTADRVTADLPDGLRVAAVRLYEADLELGSARWKAGQHVAALECFWRAEELGRVYGIQYEGAATFEMATRLEGLAVRGDYRSLLRIAADAPPGRTYAADALELGRELLPPK